MMSVATASELDEHAVAALGSRYFDSLLGGRFRGRIHMAGGVFKTLLHGRSPRDIDLWAFGDATRLGLLDRLRARGATLVADNAPYNQVFEVGDQTIEVGYSTHYETIRERVATFDIGLSAVGCSWDHGRLVPFVHPLARESTRRREILLIRKSGSENLLPNWKYALATLERMRRYAAELGYRLPQSEVDTIWRVFESQTEEMQRGMLERYHKVARVEADIEEEALCHIRRS